MGETAFWLKVMSMPTTAYLKKQKKIFKTQVYNSFIEDPRTDEQKVSFSDVGLVKVEFHTHQQSLKCSLVGIRSGSVN